MSVLIPGKIYRDQIDSNQLLWRYLDLSKFLDLLEHGTLFFTRADKFEDKYEGAFTPELKKKIEDSIRDNDLKTSYDEFKTKLRERVFINCWHKGVHDSMAMWKIYGHPTNGVAITTWVKRLEDILSNHDFSNISETYVYDVKYINHWQNKETNIKPYSRIFSYKLKAYQYENEIRAIIDTFHHTYENTPSGTFGIKVKVDVEKLLRSIVIAPNAGEWFISLIQDIVKKRYKLNTPVRRSKLAFDPL